MIGLDGLASWEPLILLATVAVAITVAVVAAAVVVVSQRGVAAQRQRADGIAYAAERRDNLGSEAPPQPRHGPPPPYGSTSTGIPAYVAMSLPPRSG